MRNSLSLLVLTSFLHVATANLHSAIPEDLYAFPKYRVTFLNGLPVDNSTAERWLKYGLEGGEQEFLDQWHPSPVAGIESGDSPQYTGHDEHEFPLESDHQSHDHTLNPSPALEHMRLGPSKSYLCLIPPAPTLPPPPPDDSQATVTPSHSWSLLQPLAGSCLYHRQAWFTYSYCHNLHVRQFRELPTTYPHPPGARVVEEDAEWESYTLGKSPASQTVGGELTVNDELALANNLELARQDAGQRYLVQRWSDGTICDKTGRPREIEIQFHCSMTMTDTILFVKETRTCEYVLVIHTPRLCGEPGFKSRLEQMPETAIRCREVLDDVSTVDRLLPEARYPFKRKAQQPIPPPPATKEKLGTKGKFRDTVDRAQETAKILQKALRSMLGHGDDMELQDIAVFEVEEGEDGDFLITLDPEVQESLFGKSKGKENPTENDVHAPAVTGRGMTLEDALRAAGYDMRERKGNQEEDEKQKPSEKEDKHDEEKEKNRGKFQHVDRDEL